MRDVAFKIGGLESMGDVAASVKSENSDARLLLCTLAYACFFTSAERSLRDALSIYGGLGFSEFVSSILSTAFLFATMLAIATASFAKKTECFRPVYGTIGSLLLALGYGGVFAMHASSPSLALLVYSAASFGIGSSLGFLALIQELSFERDRAILIILTASVFSSAISLVMNSLSSVLDVSWICILLAALSAICFLILPFLREPDGENDRAGKAQAETSIRCANRFKALFGIVWQPALCVGALAFIASIARSLVSKDRIDETIVVTFIGAIVACFLLFVLFSAPASNGRLSKRLPRKDDVVSIYKVLFPLNAFLFLLLAFLGDWYVLFLAGVAEISATVCHILMWIQAIDFGKKLGIAPFTVLGFFSGIVYFLLSWGYLIVYLGDAFFGETLRAIIAVVAVYAMAMVLFICLREGGFLRSRIKAASCSTSKEAASLSIPEDAASPEAELAREMQLQAACERYYLSSREQEVLSMLVKGRDVPYIADSLFLSKNTIKTHIKNIYAKMGVHSRQELLDECEQLLKQPSD